MVSFHVVCLGALAAFGQLTSAEWSLHVKDSYGRVSTPHHDQGGDSSQVYTFLREDKQFAFVSDGEKLYTKDSSGNIWGPYESSIDFVDRPRNFKQFYVE